jgi:hypothetical protein
MWSGMLEGVPDLSPVVDAVVDAATAGEPQLRYLVGMSGRMAVGPAVDALNQLQSDVQTAFGPLFR